MRILIALSLLLLIPLSVSAQNVTFEWDPHPEGTYLAGYKLYQSKTSGMYLATVVATFQGGTLTTGSIPKPGLGKYYWVLTAYMADGSESDFSNEVSLVLKPKPPVLKSVVQTALMAPVKGAAWLLAKITGKDKNLKVRDADL